MKAKFVLFALAFGALTASAATITTVTVTLDNYSQIDNRYSPYNGDYAWNYTLSITNGDAGDLSGLDFTGLEGVQGVSISDDFWSANSTSDSATFSNGCDSYSDFCNYDSSHDVNFTIYSSDGTPGTADYSYSLFGEDPNGVVGGPASTAPEPASFGLTGLALLALGAFKFRRANVQ